MKWTWDENNEGELKRLWLDDVPVAKIAKALGPKVTRNMVIGKAHRMHLPPRDIAKFVRISLQERFGKRAA